MWKMWILIIWLHRKSADLDQQCFQKRINHCSAEQGLRLAKLYFQPLSLLSLKGQNKMLTCFLFFLLLRKIAGVLNFDVTGDVIGIKRPGLFSFSIARPSNLYSKEKRILYKCL